ncbi:rRNA maturation RNase YbeY [Anaerobacillus sp. MEB173]|uniref:rRNA maturation RNase YbeY n=1 Tax=Anaerobacillus sp. MEB173 TaxID=3383345 RepID=UPI003F92F412
MRLKVDFHDQTETLTPEQIVLIENLLNKAAEIEGIEEGSEVSVSFVNNDEIQEINREYRNIDKPTDVISFALNEQDEDELAVIGEGIPNLLGDIIISIPKTIEQADSYGHSFERELGFLAVHGILHLLGYDHMTEEDEKIMFSRQEEILAAYGLKR